MLRGAPLGADCGAGAPTIGRVLFIVGIDGAPLRYRAQLPAEALALRGVSSDIRHYRDPDVSDLARRADVIVAYRVPATPQVLDLIERARAAGTAVLFDVDDLIFDPTIAEEIPALRLLPATEAALWLEGVQRYRTTMEACDAYIGSTPRLVEHARGRSASRRTCSRTGSAAPWVPPARSPPRARADRARSASATSAAPPPTTTTGGTWKGPWPRSSNDIPTSSSGWEATSG
jgi:hypothetical protein